MIRAVENIFIAGGEAAVHGGYSGIKQSDSKQST
jgi:hypothetical protein